MTEMGPGADWQLVGTKPVEQTFAFDCRRRVRPIADFHSLYGKGSRVSEVSDVV